MNIFRYAALLAVALAVGACGSASGDGGGNGGAPPEAGGTLLTHGANMVHTLRLTENPDWTKLGPTSSHLPAASPRTDRLYIARHDSSADEFTVAEYDFRNLTEPQSEFTWPGTSGALAMRAIAFSADGRHVAGIINTVAGNRLSVLNIEGENPSEVVDEFSGSVGRYGLAWLDHDRIAFVLDVSDQEASEVEDFDAAIVSLNVAEHVSMGSLELQVHAGITGDAPQLVDEIRELAVSPSGNQLAYSYGKGTDPNIMIKNLAESDPHAGLVQLTSGPHAHVGAAFSPDGTKIAFSEYIDSREPTVFIIPTDLGEPINIEDSGPVRDRYRVDEGPARRILAWLP